MHTWCWIAMLTLVALPALGSIVPKHEESGETERGVSRHDVEYVTLSAEPWDAMPTGGGDLSAMVRFDGALRLHLSKSDCWGFRAPANTPPGDRFFNNVSPGHVRIAFKQGAAMAAHRFRQRLDLYRGCVALELGEGATAARVSVWGHPTRRLLVVEIDDPARALGGGAIELTEWRDTMRVGCAGDEIHAVEINTRPARPHLANTGMESYYLAGHDPLQGRGTAVAVSVTGAAPIRTVANGKMARIELPVDPPSHYAVLIAVAVNPSGDPLPVAQRELRDSAKVPLVTLRADHHTWWRDFWSRSSVEVTSADGAAKRVADAYHVHLYTLGCVNRGAYPAKWDGGPGLMRGDERNWGLSEWVQEVRFTYLPLYASNHLEIARGLPNHYSAMASYLRAQTKMMWDIPGMWVPETTLPWGHAEDFVLKRDEKAPPVYYMERWEPSKRPFGKFEGYNPYVGLMFTPGLEICQHYLTYYRYSGDEKFLREQAYPFIRDVCEFVAGLVRKGDDGQYHLDPANALETWWLVRDPADTMAGIAAIFPECVRIADRYGRDRTIRDHLAEVVSALPPPAIGLWTDQGIDPSANVYAPAAAKGRKLDRSNAEHPALYRIFPFGISRLGTADYAIARETFERRPYGICHGWSLDPIWAARLGMGEEAGKLIAEHCRQYQRFRYGGWTSNDSHVFPEGLSSTPFMDAGGLNAYALQEMLLQTVDGVVRVAPAIPAAWSGSFRLRTEGGFVVFARFEAGRATRVEVQSVLGRECRIANPFAGPAIVRASGRMVMQSADAELRFKTRRGATYIVQPNASGK
jgi:alpha-L-fucosidase 2